MAEQFTKFVSAEWFHDETFDVFRIKATGDDGQTYWIGGHDSDVPPWSQFLAEGGTITGTPPPKE